MDQFSTKTIDAVQYFLWSTFQYFLCHNIIPQNKTE